MTAQSTLTIWLLTDNKPGHRNQLRGLLTALEKEIAVNAHWIDISSWYQPIVGPVPDGKPDLILCCGHRTHIPGLLCKWCFGGFLTVLMQPSLPLWLFDFCIIPLHDNPAAKKNVITTLGVINTIEASNEQQSQAGLILIGGPSKHHGWDTQSVIEQLQVAIKASPNTQWQITTSRRTPPEFEQQLLQTIAANNLNQTVFVPYADTDPDWVNRQMRIASQIWVSEDSVSMVYESLTAGAKVGLIQVPRTRKSSRIYNSIDSLRLNDPLPFPNQATKAAQNLFERLPSEMKARVHQ